MADFGRDDAIIRPDDNSSDFQLPAGKRGASSFGADDLVIPPPTLSQGVPTAEQRAQQAEQERLAQEAADRFRALGPRTQFTAGLRHVLSQMPFARHFIDTTGDQNVADLRTGFPRTATGFGIAGHSLPFAGIGAVAPWAFSNLPMSMLSSGTIEGVDTAVGGGSAGDIARSAGEGAFASIPGSLLGRAITPRSEAGRIANIKRGRDDIRAINAGHDIPNIQIPPWNLNLSPFPRIESAGEAALLASLLGGDIRHMAGAAVAGAGSDLARQGVQRLLTRERRGILDPFMIEMTGGPPQSAFDRLIYRYLNNRTLRDSHRAMLNAIGGPVTQGLVPPAMDAIGIPAPLSETLLGR